MSEKNFEVVQRSIEAWNRRDLAAWLAVFSPDAEIDCSRARGFFKGVYGGRGKQEAFWNVFWSTFEDIQLKSSDFTEAGSEVVISNTARMQGGGIEVIARSALVYTLENKQITRLRMFQEGASCWFTGTRRRERCPTLSRFGGAGPTRSRVARCPPGTSSRRRRRKSSPPRSGASSPRSAEAPAPLLAKHRRVVLAHTWNCSQTRNGREG